MKNEIWKKPCLISPSLISCFDMCNLERDVKIMERAGIEILHIDILDGHFSPSMPLGLDAVRQLRSKTDLMFDVHVMTTNNGYFINELIDIGVDQIVFHVEEESHVDGMLNRIHDAGIRAGIALKPGTSLGELDYVLEKCDTVLLMLINPGYASSVSESQVPYASRKIIELRKLIECRKANTIIELDGRISKGNLRLFGRDTANIFVAGSTCLDKKELFNSTQELLRWRDKFLKSEEK